MCGIIGYLNKGGEPVESSVIERMTAMLSHRGPHGDGVHTVHNVSIGHRRLAIIDLKAGKQPMSNEDDTLWITYNGELYNYKELQKILKEKGHLFKTHSDTEVIIHAYEEWGKRAVEYFRGMFAFAIIDTRREEIFLARDHIGIKPLVYFNNDKYFSFASELQAFHALPEFDHSINIEAVDQYLRLQYVPPPLTIYKHACKLLPAHRMAVNFKGEIKYNESYWELEFTPDYSKNEDQWIEELDHVLRDSVKKHLIADVPVGAFLSGGIDSTVIVKYMTEIQGANTPRTFSVGFDYDAYSELPFADLVSRTYKTEHSSEIVTHSSLDILSDLVKHYGEPFGDDSCIPTYYLSKFAGDRVTVVLSGDGGDELFCGYTAYQAWSDITGGQYSDFYKNFPLWKKMLYPLIHRLYSTRYPNNYYIKHDPSVESWIDQVQFMSNDWKKRLWKENVYSPDDSVPELFTRLSNRVANLSPVQMAQYLDINTLLPSALLPKVDIASMMNGLEVRTPFVDKNVIEFATKIPAHMNLRKNGCGEYTGKYLLKKILNKDFPSEFTQRTKMGFTPPIAKWFSTDGEKRSLVEKRLLDPQNHISEYFNIDVIKQLFVHNKKSSIWLLLVLEEWFENVHAANRLQSL